MWRVGRGGGGAHDHMRAKSGVQVCVWAAVVQPHACCQARCARGVCMCGGGSPPGSARAACGAVCEAQNELAAVCVRGVIAMREMWGAGPAATYRV